ncbi:DUF5977 domain-containing protein [Mucilaginibacter lutimaris]|uniref:DUF5977 domain-containing protein n=1 Tax=Mucilaginibacter lutimaris TaxID=931629 RepID=A0ABW2ZIS0_9SPHI
MNKLLLALMLLFLTGKSCFSQNTQNPTNYIRTELVPASPNASSLGKYGEVPLNLSTGAPSINLPLFTVGGSQLSLPITLNYSYDGYRPTQPIGWAGLGWSLNAGGVISKTVKGRLDESASSGRNFDDDYVKGKIEGNKDVEFLNGVYNGLYDTEPDIYSFNFGKYSGKFIKYKGTFHCFPYQKLDIGGNNTGFTITAEDGTKYEFNEVETTRQKGSSSSPYTLPTYVSSWYLTKITNAAGTENIYLEYTSEGTIVQPGTLSQTFQYFLSTTNNNNPNISHENKLFEPVITYPTYVTPKRLITIVSDRFTASFNASPDNRTDINQDLNGSARALDNISITSSNGRVVKNISLKHSYSGAGLQLDSLIENAYKIVDNDVLVIDPANTQKHAFSYNAVDGVSPKIYAAVDHFGYFRGGSYGYMMMPSGIVPNGIDRSPNMNAAQGALNRINYPTGGYTTLDYELHKKYAGNQYKKDDRISADTIVRPVLNPNGFIEGSGKSFIINYDQDAVIYVQREVKSPSGDGFTHNAYKDFDLYKIVNGNSQLITSGTILLEAENSGKAFTVTLSPGQYRLKTYCDVKEKGMIALVQFKMQTNIPIEGEDVGGIRVKKTIDYPVVGLPITKEYKYTNSLGFSTGQNVWAGYESSIYTERFQDPELPWSYYDNVYNNISSFVGENYYMGVPQYYLSVTEAITSGTVRSSTRTDFVSYNDFYMGTEPLRVTHYKLENGIEKPVQRISYNYQLAADTFLRAMKIRKIFTGHAGPPPLYDYEPTVYQLNFMWKYLTSTTKTDYRGSDSIITVTNNYYDVPKTRNLLSTQTTDSRGRQLITRFKYPESYAPALNSPFITAHVLDPVWEKQVWLKTGTDSALVSAVLNQYSPTLFQPVKMSSLSAPNITSLNNELKGTNNLYTTMVSDTRFDERVNYTYDNFGKLATQQLKFGPAISYKWGYPAVTYYIANQNKVQVIAECKNVADTGFFHENFEENMAALVDVAHTGYRSVSSYTANWIKPNARAYIITYWYRTGGIWKYKSDPYVQNYVCVGGDHYDDICIYPADAQMTTYTYDPGVGVKSIIDAKANTTYFEYDNQNRLKSVRDQDGNIVKNYVYNIAGSNLNGNMADAAPYANQTIFGYFTKNDCGDYYQGSVVKYTVPGGTYRGMTQQEADGKAQADLSANGQANANARGKCTQMGLVE